VPDTCAGTDGRVLGGECDGAEHLQRLIRCAARRRACGDLATIALSAVGRSRTASPMRPAVSIASRRWRAGASPLGTSR